MPINYTLLETAAREFIAKCDRGQARSVDSYRKFKIALGEPIIGHGLPGAKIFTFLHDIDAELGAMTLKVDYQWLDLGNGVNPVHNYTAHLIGVWIGSVNLVNDLQQNWLYLLQRAATNHARSQDSA
jgi:hypothetical protein